MRFPIIWTALAFTPWPLLYIEFLAPVTAQGLLLSFYLWGFCAVIYGTKVVKYYVSKENWHK